MQTETFEKILDAIVSGLGNAESIHPDFCQRIHAKDSNKKDVRQCLDVYRERNEAASMVKNESAEDVLFEECYEMLECSLNNDPVGVYYESRDVAVVAIRIMEKALKGMSKNDAGKNKTKN